jgi:hypothetical protein
VAKKAGGLKPRNARREFRHIRERAREAGIRHAGKQGAEGDFLLISVR